MNDGLDGRVLLHPLERILYILFSSLPFPIRFLRRYVSSAVIQESFHFHHTHTHPCSQNSKGTQTQNSSLINQEEAVVISSASSFAVLTQLMPILRLGVPWELLFSILLCAWFIKLLVSDCSLKEFADVWSAMMSDFLARADWDTRPPRSSTHFLGQRRLEGLQKRCTMNYSTQTRPMGLPYIYLH